MEEIEHKIKHYKHITDLTQIPNVTTIEELSYHEWRESCRTESRPESPWLSHRTRGAEWTRVTQTQRDA